MEASRCVFRKENPRQVEAMYASGEVHGCKFYMGADQFGILETYSTDIGRYSGRGSSFFLEIPMGVRFYILSVLFTEEELKEPGAVVRCDDGKLSLPVVVRCLWCIQHVMQRVFLIKNQDNLFCWRQRLKEGV